jgi:hypothetical protein
MQATAAEACKQPNSVERPLPAMQQSELAAMNRRKSLDCTSKVVVSSPIYIAEQLAAPRTHNSNPQSAAHDITHAAQRMIEHMQRSA